MRDFLGHFGSSLRVTLRVTYVTLEVSRGHFEGPLGTFWEYPKGHFEETLGSLWKYSGLTLRVPGVTLGLLWVHFGSTLG